MVDPTALDATMSGTLSLPDSGIDLGSTAPSGHAGGDDFIDLDDAGGSDQESGLSAVPPELEMEPGMEPEIAAGADPFAAAASDPNPVPDVGPVTEDASQDSFTDDRAGQPRDHGRQPAGRLAAGRRIPGGPHRPGLGAPPHH